MDSRVLAAGILLLAFSAFIEYSKASTNVFLCNDDNPKFITCPANTAIHLLDVTYGRKRRRCNVWGSKSCKSAAAERIVRQNCEGKRICMIEAKIAAYGNPCSWPGKSEYMDLTYECRATSPIKTVQICENQFNMVRCPAGQIIDVKSAFYGRTSSIPCAVGDTSDTQCSVSAIKFAKFYCHGKSFCVPGANSGALTDPCPGISKYMEMKYECIDKPVQPTTPAPTTTPSPYRRVQICENQFSFVRCPAGKIIDIKSAFYGRKSRQPCPIGDTSNTQCSVDAMKHATFYCQGRGFCVPGANSGALTDPCQGISKYLEIIFDCIDKDATKPPTAPPTPPIPVDRSTRPPIPTVPPTCGVSYMAQSRIVGGTDANPGSWPWQVAIYRRGAFICGGTLINAQWIITATHCVENDPLALDYHVILGDHDRSRNEGTEVRVDLEKVIKHPQYGEDYTYNNDIAFLKMVRPVIFNRRIAPACLPQQGAQVPVGTNCYLSGWGWVDFPGYAHQVLQQGSLPVVSKSECRRRLQNSANSGHLGISDQMLCAGFSGSSSSNPDTSACRGDSGGPFVCRSNQGQWVLQGVVSWGSVRCSDRDRYSVFARVSEYRDLIDAVVKNDGLPTTPAPPTTQAPRPTTPDTQGSGNVASDTGHWFFEEEKETEEDFEPSL